MLLRFFRWWGGELAAMLPDAMRRGRERRVPTLRLTVVGSEITLEVGSGERYKMLGRVPRIEAADGATADRAGGVATGRDASRALLRGVNPKRTRVEVGLAPEQALSKEVELPLAAEEDLHRVLGYEMERLTPFKADDVYYAGRIIERDPAAHRLRVRLDIARKRTVEEALAPVSDWPLPRSGAGVEVVGAPDRFAVRFYPRALGARAPSRLNSFLSVSVLVLLAVVIALPLVQQQQVLTDLRTRAKAARAAAGAASALRERLVRIESETRFIAQRKAAAPAAVLLLEEVSAVLPDSTWLTRLELGGGTLELRGTSDSASALIPIIEKSRLLRRVRFDSPVTQIAATGRERFQLSAEVVVRESP